MALTRRQGLMGIVGSIFAGPEVGKEVINLIGDKSNLPKWKAEQYAMTGVDKGNDIRINPIWKEEKRTQLLKLINGDLEDWQKQELERDDISENTSLVRLKAFKSVSNVVKNIWHNEHMKQHKINNWIEQAKKEFFDIFGFKP